jgi:hypothetical protein
MILQYIRSRKKLSILCLAMTLVACSGRGCTGCATENCEECVKRCVETQGVSPDVCQTTACASVCQKK